MKIRSFTNRLKASKIPRLPAGNKTASPLRLTAFHRIKKPVLLLGLAVMLTACTTPKFAGCNDISCRPVSDDHAMTIWWQPDMRNGPFDYTQAAVNE